MIVRPLLALACLALSACTSKIYDDAEPGKFSGTILVMWVEPGPQDEGDGKFVYVPGQKEAGDALVFDRGDQKDPAQVHIDPVEPQWMYTDGGSIPRILQPVKGLNPWGYAPAYMVHDWLFLARNCIRANDARPEELKVEKVTFRESYAIMAEMLKTLEMTHRLSKSDLQPRGITWAVSSGISRNRWEGENCPRISDHHMKQIRARLRIGPEGRQKTVVIDGEKVVPAAVVQEVEF